MAGGRRKIANLGTLLSACRAQASWHCAALPVGVSLLQAAAALSRANIFVSPHGADMVNAFAMPAGAAVIEIMPEHRGAC
jgi:hypothetical protein